MGSRKLFHKKGNRERHKNNRTKDNRRAPVFKKKKATLKGEEMKRVCQARREDRTGASGESLQHKRARGRVREGIVNRMMLHTISKSRNGLSLYRSSPSPCSSRLYWLWPVPVPAPRFRLTMLEIQPPIPSPRRLPAWELGVPSLPGPELPTDGGSMSSPGMAFSVPN